MTKEAKKLKTTARQAVAGLSLGLVAPLAMAKTGGTTGPAIGGKSQVGVSHLAIDMTPDQSATVCYATTSGKSYTGILPSDVSLVVNANASAASRVNFTVGDIVPDPRDRLMILVYGKRTTPSPDILTPKSTFPLKISMIDLEILGMYNLPALTTQPQASTRIGQANPSPRGKYTFNVNLDNSKLPAMIRDGDTQIHVQAAIIAPDDLNRGEFGNMILSDLKTVTLVPDRCPEATNSISTDSSGGKTTGGSTGSTGGTTKTK
jgi:hypothetical protein